MQEFQGFWIWECWCDVTARNLRVCCGSKGILTSQTEQKPGEKGEKVKQIPNFPFLSFPCIQYPPPPPASHGPCFIIRIILWTSLPIFFGFVFFFSFERTRTPPSTRCQLIPVPALGRKNSLCVLGSFELFINPGIKQQQDTADSFPT